MNWVEDERADASRIGHHGGYWEAMRDATSLLDDSEGLPAISKWLEAALDRRKNRYVYEWGSRERKEIERKLEEEAPPQLKDFIGEANDNELQSCNATEVDRIKAAASDLQNTLTMFMVLFTQGSDEFAKQYGDRMKFTDLAKAAREALDKFEHGG